MIPEYKTVFDLLSDQKRWTTRYFAVNQFGLPTTIHSPEACRFCLSGAISRVYKKSHLAMNAQLRLAPEIARNPAKFNDNSTHAEVLAAVKEAGI